MERKSATLWVLFVSAVLGTSCLVTSSGGGGGSSQAVPVLTLASTTELTIGDLWCIPVFDGTDLVVSSETGGTVVAAKFDLDLNLLAGPITVADTADTFGGDTIADHKHIFQNGFHFLAFSTAGAGDGGYLYLLKLDTDLARIGIVEVVNNDAPTNDMFLVGNGTDVFVGKYSPFVAGGHQVFEYDENLNYVDDYLIGMPDHAHANGAAAIFHDSLFQLVAPETLSPGNADFIYGISADATWTPVGARRDLIEDPGFVSLATGLTFEPVTGTYLVHYIRDDAGDGGDIYRAVFDTSWNRYTNESVIAGQFHRPHGVIVDGRLYLGYDGNAGGVFKIYVSIFDIS